MTNITQIQGNGNIIINGVSYHCSFYQSLYHHDHQQLEKRNKKPNTRSMVVTSKLIKNTMTSLRKNEKMTKDKCLMLAAWQLKKGLALFGSVSKKVSP
jgi:hypothetical protein